MQLFPPKHFEDKTDRAQILECFSCDLDDVDEAIDLARAHGLHFGPRPLSEREAAPSMSHRVCFPRNVTVKDPLPQRIGLVTEDVQTYANGFFP